MPIERDMNSIRKTLDQPENKRIAKELQNYIDYLCRQYRYSKNRERLVTVGVYEILKKVHEDQMMLDGDEIFDTDDNPL